MDTRLAITHETHYLYSKPTYFGPHRLVLRPRESHDLQVESLTLDITPACEIDWSWDVFGNSVAKVEFLDSGAELRIVNQVTTRQRKDGRNKGQVPPKVAYPVVYDDLEQTIVAAYQAPAYPQESSAILSWANEVAQAASSDDAITKATLINQAIFRTIRYQRRDAKGVQFPCKTLSDGTGSCRDMATLLMESCRALKISARFISGYLDCAAARAGTASTHAWTEVYFPECGWIGFDPSLGEWTSDKHIAIGVSNHPRGVMPISGRFFGNSFDYLGMKVSVKIEKWTSEAIKETA